MSASQGSSRAAPGVLGDVNPGEFYDRAREVAGRLLESDEHVRHTHVAHLRNQNAAFAALVEQQMRTLAARDDQELLRRAERLADSVLGMPAARRYTRMEEIRGESQVLHHLVVDCMHRRQSPRPVAVAPEVESRAQVVASRRTPTPPNPDGVLIAQLPTEELRAQIERLVATRPNMSNRIVALPRGETTVTDSAALRQARRIRGLPVLDRLGALEQVRGLDPVLYEEVIQLLTQMADSFDGATLPADNPLPGLDVLARQFSYIPDTHVPARVAAWIVLRPGDQHVGYFQAVDRTWPPYGLQVRQEYHNFLTDNDYFAISRWGATGPLRSDAALDIEAAMALVPDSVATGLDNVVGALMDAGVTPEDLRAAANGPSTERRVSLPPVLVQCVQNYEAALRARRDQLANVGDWIQLVESSRTFTKIAGRAANLRPESTMGPGRPLTHTAQVTRVDYRIDANRNLMMEHVEITVNARTQEGRRVMPGVTDNTLMLPCSMPGCRKPHLNDHPFCRDHRADDPSVELVAVVERRRDAVRAMLEGGEALAEETRAAMTADAQMLHEYVRDKQAVARRRQQAEERRQREREAAEAAQRQLTEENERAELQRLMAKHGVRAAPRPTGGPVEGERNLEV